MQDSSDENLKALWAPRPDCLETEELASLLEPGGHSLAGWQHVNHCAHCQAQLDLLRSFLNPQISAQEQPHVDMIVRHLRQHSPASRRPWWRRFFTPGVLAPAVAAAALAVVIFIGLEHRRPGEVVIKPGDEVTRSQSIEILNPAGDIDRVPDTIVWKPAPGANSYRIQLFEIDRTPLWGASAGSNQIVIPAKTREQITPGKALLCQVEALDQSRNVLATSGLIRFRLRLGMAPAPPPGR